MFFFFITESRLFYYYYLLFTVVGESSRSGSSNIQCAMTREEMMSMKMLKESAERLMLSMDEASILWNADGVERKLLFSNTPRKDLNALVEKHKPKFISTDEAIILYESGDEGIKCFFPYTTKMELDDIIVRYGKSSIPHVVVDKPEIYEVLLKSDVNLAIKEWKERSLRNAAHRLKQAEEEASPCWKEEAVKLEKQRQKEVPPEEEAKFIQGMKDWYKRTRCQDDDCDFISTLWRRDKLWGKIPEMRWWWPRLWLEISQLIIRSDSPTEPTNSYGEVIVNGESYLKFNSLEKISQTEYRALLIDTGFEVNQSQSDNYSFHRNIQVKLEDKLSGCKMDKCFWICYCDPDGYELRPEELLPNEPSDCVAKIIYPRRTYEQDYYDERADDGNIKWNKSVGLNIKWNKSVVQELFRNTCFSAELEYAMLDGALKAVVEVRLILKPNTIHIPADVYGSILGCILTCDDDQSRILSTTLFKKSRDECMSCKNVVPIPLSRSSMAVLEKSRFQVCINLMNRLSPNHDEEIVSGVAEFFPSSPPDCSTITSTKYIIGKCGEVQVRVNKTLCR